MRGITADETSRLQLKQGEKLDFNKNRHEQQVVHAWFHLNDDGCDYARKLECQADLPLALNEAPHSLVSALRAFPASAPASLSALY